MPLAKSYNPNPQAAKSADVGPTPYQQMSSAFVNASVNPQLKVFQYTVLPAVKGIPIIGDALRWAEGVIDPIGELKKELNISPTIGGAIGEGIVSHSVGAAVKVFAAGLGAASGGQIASGLVQNAISYEWANQAMMAKRNPGKFIIQGLWNNLFKGDFLDHFIYDKTYLFHKAVDRDGERYARWRNNKIFENFNDRAEKYGVRLEGAEQKLGSYSFTSILTDKHKGPLNYFLKGAKVGWQVLGPSAITLAIFPPAAIPVLVWQFINADWEQFVTKTPFKEMEDPKRGIAKSIEQSGEFNGKQDGAGRWMEGGDRIRWHGSYVEDKLGIHLIELQPKDRFFRTLSDFGTLGGLYRTFVTGGTLEDRAFHFEKFTDQSYFNNQLVVANNTEFKVGGKVFVENPNAPGWDHVGWHKGSNSKIYEKVVKLANGEVRVRMYKDLNGAWKFAQSIGRSTVYNKFWLAAFRVQQFGKTIIGRFAAPIALAVIFPNPVTAVIAAYHIYKGTGELLASVKRIGWVTKEMKKTEMIKKFANKYGAALNSIKGPMAIVLSENGTSFFRRAFRRIYSLLRPFDREVGVLRGLLEWREAQWTKFITKHTGTAKVIEFLERIPFAGALFKSSGFLLGGVKWVIAPGQAIKDSIWDFARWVTWKGFRFAFGHAIRKWIMRPLTRVLLGWTKSLPPKSFQGRVARWLLGKFFGAFRPPSIKPPGFLGKIFSPVLDAIKQLIGRLIRAIVRFIVRLIVEIVKKVVQVVVEGIKAIFNIIGISTLPVWLPVLIGVVIIFALILLVALLLVFIVMAFLASMAPGSPYQSGPESDYLAIRKEVLNAKPSGALFVAGDTIEYSIRYKIKKNITGAVEFEDKFLYANSEGGVTKNFFDPDSLSCQSPANITANSLNPDPAGPPGLWKSLIGTVPGPVDPPDWQDIVCQAKVAATYTGGTLVNHAVIKAKSAADNKEVSASQFLYVNGGSPSGWPTEHGCFVQGPNGAFTHQNQQAVDIVGNYKIGLNISNAPVFSTINGKVLRICPEGYATTTNSGVCGGYDEGSYFGDTKGNGGFGTYVILKETNTKLSLFYAHLAGPRADLTEGSAINKGDVVGYADTTGYSEGPHLHYAFTRNSGAQMNQPFIPYYVPTCSNTSPDPTCAAAFSSIGEPGRVCY